MDSQIAMNRSDQIFPKKFHQILFLTLKVLASIDFLQTLINFKEKKTGKMNPHLLEKCFHRCSKTKDDNIWHH
jgi:hypothetical protein